ncbi:MAG: permease of the major facilitator superfamily, partial [Microbacterium sp.]|nr:permease of the major facilitator superfamily [Microbacterium sp.]
FRSPTFSMATVIGVLVGFGMFGAMLTLPLYLQLVLGSSPTQSGLEMLPMILGLMIASIGSGQIIARTGRYRMFPILGTLLMSVGFFLLTFLKYDSPYWHVAIAMLVIGLGLGQLMQTLTIASQNSVGLRDMGVATSGSTFFRQIGGTLGTAVLLSLLFTLMPTNIIGSFSDRTTLTDALDAAFDPTVATAPANEKIMSSIYTPIVTRTTDAVTQQAQQGVQQATDAATQAVAAQVEAGAIPAAAQAQATQAAVTQAIAAATTQIQQQIPVARVATDGTVSLDFSDASQRAAFVDTVATNLQEQFSAGDENTSIGDSTLDDTSFLVGADARLTKPFLVGFNSSAVSVYWVAMSVVLLAFVLSLFFRTPPLRAKSALQEAADERRGRDDEEKRAEESAAQTGALLAP